VPSFFASKRRAVALDVSTNLIALRVSASTMDALRQIQERDGVPISEQARRGIALWLKEKGASRRASAKGLQTATKQRSVRKTKPEE
jgi:hypothetical protein